MPVVTTMKRRPSVDRSSDFFFFFKRKRYKDFAGFWLFVLILFVPSLHGSEKKGGTKRKYLWA